MSAMSVAAIFLVALALLHIVRAAPLVRNVRIDDIDVDTHADIVIDSTVPRFTWALDDEWNNDGARQRGVAQLSYRITIASLQSGQFLCDTGTITSQQTTHVRCDAVDGVLRSDSRYEYSIQYASNTGAISTVHRGVFRTALYNPQVDFRGDWIGGDSVPVNQLRKEFAATANTVNATVFICGIGYYHLFINGRLVDPSRRLDPGWTTYERRTYYTSFDVTSLLQAGAQNAVGVVLGLGWYNREQWAAGLGGGNLPLSYGPPARLLFQLNMLQRDGSVNSVVSDSSWSGRSGPNTYDGIYMGSTYDSRMESAGWNTAGYVDSRFLWLNATVLPSPFGNETGILQQQPMDPIRIGHDNLHFATSAAKTGWYNNPPGVRGATINESVIIPLLIKRDRSLPIYDLQQNIAGWCIVNKTSMYGSSMQLRYSETLLPHKDPDQVDFEGLNTDNNEYIAVTDNYIFHSNQLESFEPQFTYHGFRFIGIAGSAKPLQLQCYPVHSETTLVGNFTASSVVLNQIQHNHLWSMLSNIMSLPTDCPQRNERRGWLGDAGLSVDMALFNFDLGRFYRAFLQIIQDNQDVNGPLPDTAPFTCCYRPTDPGWGVAFSQIVKMHFAHYNDSSVVSTFYDAIEKWILYLNTRHAETGLANFYHVWGDWEPAGTQTNISLITSFSYLKDVNNLIELSDILNKTDKSATYKKLYQQLANEWHTVFYHPEIKGYADNIQAANVLSLALPNVVPDDLRATVVSTLIDRIQSDGHITEGIISIDRLFPVLSTNGHHDLAVQLALRTDHPSYGYMSNNPYHNATTLWETWGGSGSSYNHHMYGTIGAWFYRYVAGIDIHGLDHVTVWPRMTYNATILPTIQAEAVTLRGPINVDWSRATASAVTYSIAIPNGMTSDTVFDPVGPAAKCVSITESGIVLWKRSGVHNSKSSRQPILNVIAGVQYVEENDDGVMTARVGGGQYNWHVEWDLSNTK